MSKRRKDIKLFINDILESIEKIVSYTQAITYNQFIEDDKTKDAVIRNLEVIGEAVKNIPSATKKKYPDINWKAIAGMRDKLIHEYFGVSYPIVWETIRNDLPTLKAEIKKVLNKLEKD
ncbi:MAG: HepT-like ribonuclease domain-containing protein [Thermodesulfobacteriota bacterium]